MTNDAHKLAIELREAIRRTSEYDRTDIVGLFMECETIIGILAYFIKPLTESEAEYRQRIVDYMEQGDSHAKAEAKAQTTPEYITYRKMRRYYDLASEQIKIIKKFKEDLTLEHQRT